jgi:hypothetical protein
MILGGGQTQSSGRTVVAVRQLRHVDVPFQHPLPLQHGRLARQHDMCAQDADEHEPLHGGRRAGARVLPQRLHEHLPRPAGLEQRPHPIGD